MDICSWPFCLVESSVLMTCAISVSLMVLMFLLLLFSLPPMVDLWENAVTDSGFPRCYQLPDLNVNFFFTFSLDDYFTQKQRHEWLFSVLFLDQQQVKYAINECHIGNWTGTSWVPNSLNSLPGEIDAILPQNDTSGCL